MELSILFALGEKREKLHKLTQVAGYRNPLAIPKRGPHE